MKPQNEGEHVPQHADEPQGSDTRLRIVKEEDEDEEEEEGGEVANDGMTQRRGLIDEAGASVPVIASRRPSNRTQGHARRGRDRMTTRSGRSQERDGVVRGALKGWELDALFMKADHRGVYKRFLVWGWLVPACLLVPCAHLNILLMLYLPPSNCTLPTPPRHIPYEDWRSFATPRTPKGELDSCALYDFPSALKDPRYDPGIHKQYNTISYNTHTNLQHPTTSPEPPGTPHDPSTPKGDTGTFENVPGISRDPGIPHDPSIPEGDTGTFENVAGISGDPSTSHDPSIPEEEDTSTLEYVSETTIQPEGDTGMSENVPGFSDHSHTLGKDTVSFREDPRPLQEPGILQHPSDTKDISGGLEQRPRNTSALTSASEYTPEDISTPKQVSKQHSSITADTNMQEQQSSTPEQHNSTQEIGNNTSEQHVPTHGQTHTSHVPEMNLAKSRVARGFDPFNDLYDPRKEEEEEGGQTVPEHKHDPMEEYLKAVKTWRKYYPKIPPPGMYTMGCVFGYDFDRTYVQESLPMQFGWVCAESHFITRILHVSMAGNVIGSILFGALADRVGRKGIFMLLSVKVAVLGSLFVLAGGTGALMMLRFLVALGMPAIYQVMIITALEQVRDGERGLVTSLSSVCFSLGQCLLALFAWLTGTWVLLGLVTSLPVMLALVYGRLVEESPQWLVSRGREMDAALVLQRVTIRNNSKHQQKPSLFALRARIKEITTAEGEDVEALCSGTCGWIIAAADVLVTYPYVSFRVVLVTVCWIVNLVLYFITTMKYPHVSNNPYLGWFFTSVMEVPANLLMPLLLRFLGRRALHSAGLAVCSLALFTIAGLLAAGYKENFLVVSGLVLVVKFCCSMTYLVVILQAAELNPTPIRSCVTGLASLVALSVNIFSPAILDVPDPFYEYLLLGTLGFIGALSALLLPETTGRSLPQTLQEAENFAWRRKTNTAIVTAAQEVERENGGVVEEREVQPGDGEVPLPPPLPPPEPSASFHLSALTGEARL